MIQNILFSGLTPLKNKNEINCWENRPFTTVWPENTQQKKIDVTRTIKKKQKRVRTAFTTEQLRALEKTYSRQKYIDGKKRAALANSLNIGDKCIKIWFQNRRMKEKRGSTEASCDSSSESGCNESVSTSSSPPLEVVDAPTTDHVSELPSCPDSTYHLPAYFNTNQIQAYETSYIPPAFPNYFFNDNNVYPTQYYPLDVNYLNSEVNSYDQYGSEMNNCWGSSDYPYYSVI